MRQDVPADQTLNILAFKRGLNDLDGRHLYTIGEVYRGIINIAGMRFRLRRGNLSDATLDKPQRFYNLRVDASR